MRSKADWSCEEAINETLEFVGFVVLIVLCCGVFDLRLGEVILKKEVRLRGFVGSFFLGWKERRKDPFQFY